MIILVMGFLSLKGEYVMRFFLLLAVVSALSFPKAIYAGDYMFSTKNFTARVGNVRLQSLLVEQGKENEDTVDVQANVYMFEPSINIDDVRGAEASDIEEVDFLVEYTKANIEGDVAKIASFWAPDERSKIKEQLSDPEMLSRSMAYFEKYPGLNVVGIVDQGATKSILQRSLSMVFGANIKESGGQIYLTNKPANDLELAIIEASFVK